MSVSGTLRTIQLRPEQVNRPAIRSNWTLPILTAGSSATICPWPCPGAPVNDLPDSLTSPPDRVIYAGAQHSGGQPPPSLEPNAEASPVMCTLLIPDYDPENPKAYPGNIQPGVYQGNEIVELLRQHSANPEAIWFIADMLEE
jgi:hypothetical protein